MHSNYAGQWAFNAARAVAIPGLFCLAALCALSHSASARQATAQVVMSGLNNPRGLAFAPDGSLYVTEAGTGAVGTGVSSPATVLGISGDTTAYGATSSLSRYTNGIQSRVLTGLPSLAVNTDNGPQQPAGNGATGLQNITFVGDQAYGVIGSPGAGNERAALNTSAANNGVAGTPGNKFGRLVQLNLGATPSANYLADFVPVETSTNPDGGDVNSNPYGITSVGGKLVVVDAGANVLWNIGSDLTTVSLSTIIPPQSNPLFPTSGGPNYQAVPTSVALSPKGVLFVSELGGYPFKQGGATIYTVPSAGGTPTPLASGFTTAINLTFGPDGQLYVLDLTQNGLGPEATTGPGGGQLYRVDPATGAKTLISVTLPAAPGGLLFSTGMAFAPDGSLYVSNLGTSPGGGQVLRLTGVVAVPEANAGLLALVGGAVLLTVRRARRE